MQRFSKLRYTGTALGYCHCAKPINFIGGKHAFFQKTEHYETLSFFFPSYHPHPKDGGMYCFQFLLVHNSMGGGYSIQGLDGGYPIPGPGGYPIQLTRDTPSQVQVRGYPIQLMGGGVTHTRFNQGVSHPADLGTLSLVQVDGYPPPGLNGVPPPSGDRAA